MQYPLHTLLGAVTVLVTLFLGVMIFYLVVKKWQGTKFLTAVKAIVIYEAASFLLYLIYPFKILPATLNLLLFSGIAFFVFYFIMKKFLQMNLKKSLIIFILIIIVIFPLLDYFGLMFQGAITKLPIFAEESLKMQEQIQECMQNLLTCLSGDIPEPLSLKIIGKIEVGTLSWPGTLIRSITISSIN